jgi:SanA protein
MPASAQAYLQSALAWLARSAKLIGLAIAAVILFVLLIPVMMRERTELFIYSAPAHVPATQVALVLGASVRGSELSEILRARTDAAIALYKAGRVSKILVTGDNGALNHDEVTPVRKYLIDAGVAAGDIFLDHAGFDTYSSMYRARSVFEVKSMTVVTQDFHLPRAVFLARTLGIEAYGLVADENQGGLYNYLREIPASWKALYDLVTVRVPEYLGAQIPIEGDGSTTWY